MRQWTATHMAKLARKASRAVGKKGTDLPGQIARRVDQNILRKFLNKLMISYLLVVLMVKQQHLT